MFILEVSSSFSLSLLNKIFLLFYFKFVSRCIDNVHSPYANRTVDIDLPFVAGQARVTVKMLWTNFFAKCLTILVHFWRRSYCFLLAEYM